MNPHISSKHLSPLPPSASPSVWPLYIFGVFCLSLIIWNSFIAYLTVQDLEHRDFSRFYYSALAYLQNHDMYSQSPATLFRWSGLYAEQLWNLNPPIFHLLFLPLTYLTLPTAFATWVILSFLAFFFSIHVIRRELALSLNPSYKRLLLLGILGFAGTGALLHTGQLTFLLLVPFTLSWIYARKGRWGRAGVFLGFLSAIKPFFLIFLPFLFFRRQYQGLLLFLGTFLGMFGLGFIIFGFEAHISWVHTLRDVNWTWSWINASIHGFLTRILTETPIFVPSLASPHLLLPLYLLCSGIVGVLTFMVIMKDRSPLSVDRAFLLLTIAALLISPAGWIYYLFFLIGPLTALLQGWNPHHSETCSPLQISLFRTRRWILFFTLPGYFFPIYFLTVFQPNPWATLFVGSTYFWCTGFLWISILIDGWAQVSHSKNQEPLLNHIFPKKLSLHPENAATAVAEPKAVSYRMF